MENIDYIWMAVIVLAVCLLTLAFIIVTFFVVRIYGAIEESDEVNELCTLRLIKYKKGAWRVNASDLFNENAVLIIKYGWIFKMIFYEWEILVMASGKKAGIVKGCVADGYKLYRKRIRRV